MLIMEENTYNRLVAVQGLGSITDDAVVERCFGSLKYDWIFKVTQPTREHMKQDVAAYMRHYNQERFHSSNGDMSPVNFENSQIEVSPGGLTQDQLVQSQIRNDSS